MLVRKTTSVIRRRVFFFFFIPFIAKVYKLNWRRERQGGKKKKKRERGVGLRNRETEGEICQDSWQTN